MIAIPSLFYIVGGDNSRAWSSAAGAYVDEWPSDRLTRNAAGSGTNFGASPYGLYA